MNTQSTPKQAIDQWQAYVKGIRARAERLDRSRQDEGWRLAATVGIPRCACSLHNASIDDNLNGWCKDNPQMLKIAKRANYLVNRWDASRLADAIIKRSWNRLVAEPLGFARYDLAA